MRQWLVAATVWALVGGPAWAQSIQQTASSPPPLPFGGVLVDEVGQPLAGAVTVIFAIYTDRTGGVPLWVEIQFLEANEIGGIATLLGDTSGLPVGLFASGEARWLGVQPEGHPEQPRIPFLSVPYALKAADADTVGGLPLSAFVLQHTLDAQLSAAFGVNATAFGATATTSGAAVGDGFVASETFGTLSVTGNAGFGTATPGAKVHASGGGGDMFLNPDFGGNRTALQTGNSALILAPNSAEKMRVSTNGNVGIGTTTPSARLVVDSGPPLSLDRTLALFSSQAGLRDVGVFWDDSMATLGIGTLTNHSFAIHTGGNSRPRLTVTNTGNVGIGTSTPVAKVHVVGAGGALFINPEFAGNRTAIQTATTPLVFAPASVERMRIATSGNVGIGTTTPTSKLHVAGAATLEGNVTITGNVSVGGNIAAKYQDVAEWVDALDAPGPGTVVIADPTGMNRVRTAETAYDTKVLGAVSPQPGVVLGDPGPNRVLVAQSGRVRVKVDAAYGAIAVGDLLTTSLTPGHAMRSAPIRLQGVSLHRPGSVLGKALEPLASGQGEILVLLTLQ
jgi:hypothetical protein